MIARYTCPTCGYEFAVWHLRLDTSPLEMCENCIRDFIKSDSHVIGFALNRCRKALKHER